MRRHATWESRRVERRGTVWLNLGAWVDLDRERLVRLLGMTDSDQDAEALVAIRKSNELLRAHGTSWAEVIGNAPAPESFRPYEPEGLPAVNEDWSLEPRPGYEPSARIRDTIRREFPITLVFFPLWLVAELMAIVFPKVHWNKNGPRVSIVFWGLCWSGLVSWVGAGSLLLMALP